MTIREAITQGAASLKAAGIDNPNLDASLLLAHALDTNRTALVAASPEPLSDEKFAAFCGLIERRLSGECIAYILGKKEFRGLEFLVIPSVLVPRPDTETLVEAATEKLKEWSCGTIAAEENLFSVLDLCTGSGAVAIAIKNEMPQVTVSAADISAEALEIEKINAARLLPGADIHFFSGDLYNALPASARQFSLIVCNPPYIPSETIKTLPAEVQREPRLALDGGGGGLAIIQRIIDGAPDFLLPGGSLLMEADPRQMQAITVLLEKRGFGKIRIYNDLSGQERVIGGTYE